MFLPCSAVRGRRYVCAFPMEPSIRLVAFKSAGAALEAAKRMTAGPWLLSAPDATYAVQVHRVSADFDDVVAWETDVESIVAAGLAGPSGFGVDVCDVLEDGTVRILESFTVEVETLDYDSVRARLETEMLD